jgi:GNAT superfamily N-acetyltransferase
MNEQVEITSVNPDNVSKHGFFCYKSKKKAEGYKRKLTWLNQRFAEGMQIKILYDNGRSVGFIEYIPGEYAWRAVNAPNTLFIHCLWVVGRAKGKGYGSRLLELCLEDARQQGKAGVAMTTSSRVWLADNQLLLKHGFESVDEAEPFDLMYHPLKGAENQPNFPLNWNERMAPYKKGLTLFRTDQCPYIVDAANEVLLVGEELGLETRTIEFTSAQQLQTESPTPYGVFGILHDGKLLSYHYLLQKDLRKLLVA